MAADLLGELGEAREHREYARGRERRRRDLRAEGELLVAAVHATGRHPPGGVNVVRDEAGGQLGKRLAILVTRFWPAPQVGVATHGVEHREHVVPEAGPLDGLELVAVPELIRALLGASAPDLERRARRVEGGLGTLLGREQGDAPQAFERDLRAGRGATPRKPQHRLPIGNAAPARALGGCGRIGCNAGERLRDAGFLGVSEPGEHLDDRVVVATVRVDLGPGLGGARHAVAAAPVLGCQQRAEDRVELLEVAASDTHVGEQVQPVGQEARTVVIGGGRRWSRGQLLDELPDVLACQHCEVRRARPLDRRRSCRARR